MSQTIAERMAEDAANAVTLTEEYFTKRLDFSEESVQLVEELVDDMHYTLPQGKTPQNVALLSELWGAYIGEVFRRNVGGEWITWEDQWGKAPAIALGGTKIFPQDKVRKRFTNGPEDNLWHYYQTFRDLLSSQQ